MRDQTLGSVLNTTERLLKLLKDMDDVKPDARPRLGHDAEIALVIDCEGRLLHLSPGFAKLVGMDGADCSGQRHPFPWCDGDCVEECRRRFGFLDSDRARELAIHSVSWRLKNSCGGCLELARQSRALPDDSDFDLDRAVGLVISDSSILNEVGEADTGAIGSQVDEIEKAMQGIADELERLGISSDFFLRSSWPSGCPELDSLSPRESEILMLFMDGSRVSNIARNLCISQHTVRNHLQSVFRKVGVGSQAELIEKLRSPATPSHASRGYVRVAASA